MAPDAKIALYRIAQEALNNVAKHSAPRTATMSLETADGGVELIVADDGRGFDAAEKAPRASGSTSCGSERRRSVPT